MRGLQPASLLVLAACSAAEAVPALSVPDTVLVSWDDAWNADDDGLAQLVPVDVMAYDAASGAPLAELAVVVTERQEGSDDGPRVDVTPVAVHEVEWRSDDQAAWWDARRDAFFDLALRAEPDPVETDADGIARFYLLVDVLTIGAEPTEGSGGVPISVTLGDVEETLLLLPR